jgi:AcrR family transcriptional regulator
MTAAKAGAGAPLGVRERVEAVISLRREEGTLASLSVAELCRLAAVNRASLYTHHRDLIRQVTASRGRGNGAQRAKIFRPAVDLRQELKVARRQIRALLLTIAELQLEVAVLQRRLSGGPQGRRKTAARKASNSS